jgi:hypothetical protein
MSDNRKVEELYPRAPRYVVDFDDNHVLRFAHMPRGSKALYTRIINLSESGMAFLIPYLSAPQLNEKIKLEFTAPNSEPIACFANVVRVQIHKSYSHDQKPQTFKLIAVTFDNIHPKQRQMLASGINQQFKKRQALYKRQQMLLRGKWFIKSCMDRIFNISKNNKLPDIFKK